MTLSNTEEIICALWFTAAFAGKTAGIKRHWYVTLLFWAWINLGCSVIASIAQSPLFTFHF